MKTYIIGIISLWSLNEQSKCDNGAIYLSVRMVLIINKERHLIQNCYFPLVALRKKCGILDAAVWSV